MGKIKDVLNSISKDDKNISRSGTKIITDNQSLCRASKSSSRETGTPSKETVTTLKETGATLKETGTTLKETGTTLKETATSSKDTVASVAPTDLSLEPKNRLSTPAPSPAEVVNRRSLIIEPSSKGAIIADTESQKVVAPVTRNIIKHEEVEEMTRAREHDRHLHFVQYHVQPVQDREVLEEVNHIKSEPVTAIQENIIATAEDAAAYESLGSQFKNEVIHAPIEKKIIDHGEKVQVREYRHVHHVVQPVIEKETYERHRIHTTISIHHIIHEAPIIQPTINHEPLNMEEFLKRGGSINSGLTHSEIGKTLLTEKRISGILITPIEPVASQSSFSELEAELSKKFKV